jgi:phosphoribosylformylglycinamidine synthase subunit PurQ / glutaminase
MKPKFGVVVFPGSNCDHDAYYSLKEVLGFDTALLWHKNTSLEDCNIIILPGGFSYGDYLRTGAIARFSPIMNSVIHFANKGGYVIGICNGFQILLEAGLLPGVMLKNKSLQFVCKDIYLSIENCNTVFTKGIEKGKKFKFPVAHGEGNYFAEKKVLDELSKNEQIVFKYTPSGDGGDDFNPNGSILNIAGIVNKKKNVLGLMPHPERSCNPVLNKVDGQLFFNAIVNNIFN